MKKLNLKQLQLVFFSTLFVNILNAQCPNPVVCSGGSNGDIVSIKLGGRGGTITRATFGYDEGIIFDGTTKINNTLTVSGSTSLSSLSVPGNASVIGNVGIGTSTPTAKLDVNGALNVSGVISFGSTAASSSSTLSVTSGSNGSIVNINVNGRGGLRTDATFGYDAGTILYQPTKLNSTLNVSGIAVFNGNVGIGCSSPTVKLAVNGKIQATEIEIKVTPCSDFVFEKDYKLMNIKSLEQFVKINKHLPEIPSAKQFQENGGYNLTQMDDLLLRKVEELTLYIIEQNKKIETLSNQIKTNTIK